MNNMSERQIVREMVRKGYTVEFGRLSICRLSDYYPHDRGLGYQVHSDDHRKPFSYVYHSLDKAVKVFVDTKHELEHKNVRGSTETTKAD